MRLRPTWPLELAASAASRILAFSMALSREHVDFPSGYVRREGIVPVRSVALIAYPLDGLRLGCGIKKEVMGHALGVNLKPLSVAT